MNRWSMMIKFLAKRLKRLPMNVLIRNLATWKPTDGQVEGYSVAIACMRDLAPVAVANLKLCARTKNALLREIILVFDCPVDQIPESVKQAVQEASGTISVALLGYDERQHRVARWINWGWVYSWLSWCLAIGHASTRAVVIHDLDALPLSLDFFEQIYDHWVQEGAEFCGIHRYKGNGTDESMGLVATFELVLDVAYIRRRFRPFDLFNKVRIVNDRVVDFDTMLFAQWQSPRRAFRPIDEMQLVHPSQLICQYTDLISGRSDFLGRNNALPMLAYFMYLGGDPGPMSSSTPHLTEAGARSIALFGRMAYIDGIAPEAWAWMEKQIRRIEQHLFDATRPEVETYLRGIVLRAGVQRTVGVESGVFAVPDR
jgi:hypothetical protein